MPKQTNEPADISARTLAHYNRRAAQFKSGTRCHDVSQNIDALLRHLQTAGPYTILDFGCGPGRDLKTLTGLGHRAIGLDGASEFVAAARNESGCEVWQQDFLRLELPRRRFDAVFANASLFHVPSLELPRVLRQLHATLKPGGALFSSNPRGANEEGWVCGRYAVYHDWNAWQGFMTDAGFVALEHFYRPTGLPFEQQPWLASVWRREPRPARRAGLAIKPGL